MTCDAKKGERPLCFSNGHWGAEVEKIVEKVQRLQNPRRSAPVGWTKPDLNTGICHLPSGLQVVFAHPQ